MRRGFGPVATAFEDIAPELDENRGARRPQAVHEGAAAARAKDVNGWGQLLRLLL